MRLFRSQFELSTLKKFHAIYGSGGIGHKGLRAGQHEETLCLIQTLEIDRVPLWRGNHVR
jgi:hypothetical protein